MPTFNGTPGDDFLVGSNGDDDMHGFDGNDGLDGRQGNDLLDGGNGHDFMRGREGNDQLFGGADDDYLDGGDGDDLLDGGSGWDRAAYSVGALVGVTVDLNIVGVGQNTGQGFDTLIGIEHLSGTRFNDVLTGDGGDNWLWGGSDTSGVTGDDVISAGGGNDLVEVGTGNHSLDGGTGIDALSLWGNDSDITAAGVTFSLLLQGAAQDTEQGLMNATGFENLSGSKYDDLLIGDGNDNVLAGDQGSDQLLGGDGNDTLYGDGRIIVDTHNTGGSGPITTYTDVVLIDPLLVSGDDTLEGGDGDDTLNGGGGSDTASYASATGAVQVFLDLGAASGAAGDDTLVSMENFLGSAFNDFARGTTGDNVLAGFGGHDLMRGLAGQDTLKGGDGDDYLEGGAGDDILDGGDGLDRVAFRTAVVTGATVDLNIQGVAQATGHGMDVLIGIEHASGNMFADTLTGNGGDNWLWGEAGSDTISGGGGNDLIQVGNGNTTAAGGTGTDTLSFGGDEFVSFITAAGVTVSLQLQGAAQATEQGSMTLTGLENLSGSNFDDNLTGDNGDNLLAGDSGADTLVGGKGDDILLGDGRVTIDSHGAATSGPIVTIGDVGLEPFPSPVGNDVLDGGKGDDTLNGGGGDDILTGGQNHDTFVFGGASGDDTITDFHNQDTIRFEGIAGVDDFGDLTLTRIGSDTLITWGTGDSVLVEDIRPSQFHVSDFTFG
jgi:Ca2+-binding RTX toxin-like protein